MHWVIYALLAAFFGSLFDLFGKKALAATNEYVVAWTVKFFTFLGFLTLLPFIGMPALTPRFWMALAVNSVVASVAIVLYCRGLKAGEISLAVPMISFTPLFLLVTSPLMLGEYPDRSGVAGILLIVAGSYFLNLHERKKGLLAPLRALATEKGPMLVLAAAFLYSITANIDKSGMLASSPLFWPLALCAGMATALFAPMARSCPAPFKEIRKNILLLALLGLANVLSLVFHMKAISIAIVPYVISIKRSGILMSVLWGLLFFREHRAKERLAAAAIMVAGVAAITLL